VGEGPTDLLLDRHEEPRRKGECREPQRDDGLEGLLAERLLADLEERVTCNPRDEKTDSDGNRSFRHRCFHGFDAVAVSTAGLTVHAPRRLVRGA